MDVYNLSNFSVVNILSSKQFSCEPLIGTSVIFTIISSVKEYFSLFVTKELQRDTKDLIENGYSKEPVTICTAERTEKLCVHGTHITSVISWPIEVILQVETPNNNNSILIVKIVTNDDKCRYVDTLRFKIPSMEKLIYQYQNREIEYNTSRSNDLKCVVCTDTNSVICKINNQGVYK